MVLSLSISEDKRTNEEKYVNRGQWIRAAVLGANDGLLSTASLLMGVGAVKADAKSMLISGASALVAGASSMAIGEFVSVSTQRDIHLSAISSSSSSKSEGVPNPFQAAAASAAAFAVGAMVPLLSAAFISDFRTRVGVVAASSVLALGVFGCLSAYYGGTFLLKGCLRLIMGGCLAMLFTFAILKLFGISMGL